MSAIYRYEKEPELVTQKPDAIFVNHGVQCRKCRAWRGQNGFFDNQDWVIPITRAKNVGAFSPKTRGSARKEGAT